MAREFVLRLDRDVFPIIRFSQFPDDDPVGGILEAIASLKQNGFSASVALTVRPAGDRHKRRIRRRLKALASDALRHNDRLKQIYEFCLTKPNRFLRLIGRVIEQYATVTDDRRSDMLLTSARRTHDAEHRLQAASDKQSRHLFETTLTITVCCETDRDIPDVALQQVAASLERFTVPGLSTFQRVQSKSHRQFDRQSAFMLNDEELATLWHPPMQNARSSRQHNTGFREMEPPVDLPVRTDDPTLSVIGQVCFRDRNEVFGIRTDDRLRHLAILGKTGMGKTTLLRSLIASDIEAGRGIAVIDPHGDLAEDILSDVPSRRMKDVVEFDAGNRQYPLAFNPLVCPNRDERALRAAGIVSAFRKLYSSSWGPRLEHIFRFSILALIETPGTSLASVAPLLTDARFRRDLVGRLKDPVVREFFSGEFQSWNDRYRTEAVAPILNKTGQMIANPILRGILAQPKSKLDLRRIMDDGRILIINLSKGRVGEDGSSLLGSLLVTCLQQAAMSRASIPEAERRDFFFYIDEFQNLSTESFATILSEARKYHLGLILANQYLDQIDDYTKSAVFGNVGSLLCFNLGSTDAAIIAEQLGPDLTPRDLMCLPKFTAYTRLLIQGQPTRPFSMKTVTCQPELAICS